MELRWIRINLISALQTNENWVDGYISSIKSNGLSWMLFYTAMNVLHIHTKWYNVEKVKINIVSRDMQLRNKSENAQVDIFNR